jgi:hypothetical protein
MRKRLRSGQHAIRGVPKEAGVIPKTIDELTVATVGHQRRADFSELVGRWSLDPAFDEIVASQRRIDSDKWK